MGNKLRMDYNRARAVQQRRPRGPHLHAAERPRRSPRRAEREATVGSGRAQSAHAASARRAVRRSVGRDDVHALRAPMATTIAVGTGASDATIPR